MQSMIVDNPYTFSFKNFKSYSSLYVKPTFIEQIVHKGKITSIPIVRKSLPNSPSLRSKLAMQGHKHFSKVVASGEDTEKILKKISSSITIKYIQSLEFDPYFCDQSCLKILAKVLKRFKTTRDFNLIIRRVDKVNETNVLCPFLPKITKMRRLRLEFPQTINIDHDGYNLFAKAIKKSNSLRALQYIFTNLSGMTNSNEQILTDVMRTNIRLEEFGCYFSTKIGGKINNVLPEPICKPYRSRQLKRLNFHCTLSGTWYLSTGEGDADMEEFFGGISQLTNLENVSFTTTKHVLGTDDILRSLACLTPLPLLSHLTYQSMNGKVSESEAMGIVLGISKLPQLKSLTLKIIQPPQLSVEGLFLIIKGIAGLENLKRLNLYFTKLGFSKEMLNLFSQQLSELNNVQYELTKGSLYIYRDY